MSPFRKQKRKNSYFIKFMKSQRCNRASEHQQFAYLSCFSFLFFFVLENDFEKYIPVPVFTLFLKHFFLFTSNSAYFHQDLLHILPDILPDVEFSSNIWPDIQSSYTAGFNISGLMYPSLFSVQVFSHNTVFAS